MQLDRQLADKFQNLIKEGEAALRRAGWNGLEMPDMPDDMSYARFKTEALNLLRRVCGENSDHYAQLRRVAEGQHTALNSYYLKECVAIVQAAERDYVGGMLRDVRSIVAAEVFDSFLEQAEHLLAAGYYHPAASLGGAVLEDALRKCCEARGVPVPATTSLDKLNTELAKAGVYDKGIFKRITGIADVRNNADHGHFDKFKKEDVEDMLKWVRRFTSDYLS